jgi:hypothetical protein
VVVERGLKKNNPRVVPTSTTHHKPFFSLANMASPAKDSFSRILLWQDANSAASWPARAVLGHAIQQQGARR